MKKILFLYSGERGKLLKLIEDDKAPDTQLYGMNHIKGDFEVSVKNFSSTLLGRIFGKYISFRLKHFLLYFYSLSSDIIFGSSLIYMLPLKKIFGMRGKLILMNTSLNRFLNSLSRNRIYFRIVNNLLKEIDIFVSLSNIQLNELRDKYNIANNKLVFIPLGVDTIFHKPEYDNRKEYILSVGNDGGRDYKTVIDVAKLMPEREFHIITNKRNLLGIDSIPSNVKIFFNLDKIELRDKFKEAGILLLALHKDNYLSGSDCSGQTVLLEGMASGLPIIVTNKAYISDYVGNNRDDYVTTVEPYDILNIVNSLKDIFYNKTKYIQKTYNSRKLIEERFSTEIMGRNLSSLFNKI